MVRILVVDDEEDIRRISMKILERAGHEVDTASDGEEGLIKATTLKPDLIVLDLMMPGMSGLEVCKLLKMRSDTKHIPIIILSALNREVDRTYAKEAGANLYMTKPFLVDELLVAIDGLMN